MPAPFTAAGTGDTSATVNNIQTNQAIAAAGQATLMPAASGKFNYLTGIQLFNTAVNSVGVTIQDGAAGAILWQGTISAGSATISSQLIVQFLTPLRSSVGNSITINTTGAAVTVQSSAQGYADGK